MSETKPLISSNYKLSDLQPKQLMLIREVLYRIFISEEQDISLTQSDLFTLGKIFPELPTHTIKEKLISHLNQESIIQLIPLLSKSELLQFFTYFQDIALLQITYEQCDPPIQKLICAHTQIHAPYTYSILSQIPSSIQKNRTIPEKIQSFLNKDPQQFVRIIDDKTISYKEVSLLAHHMLLRHKQLPILRYTKYLIAYANSRGITWTNPEHHHALFLLCYLCDMWYSRYSKVKEIMNNFLHQFTTQLTAISPKAFSYIFQSLPPYIIQHIIIITSAYESYSNFEKRKKYCKLIKEILMFSKTEKGEYLNLYLAKLSRLDNTST